MNQQKIKLPGFSFGYVIYDIVLCSILLVMSLCGLAATAMTSSSSAQLQGQMAIQSTSTYDIVSSIVLVLGVIVALIADIMILSKKNTGITVAYAGMIVTVLSILVYTVGVILNLETFDSIPMGQQEKDMAITFVMIFVLIFALLRVIHLVVYFFAIKKAAQALKPQQFGFN